MEYKTKYLVLKLEDIRNADQENNAHNVVMAVNSLRVMQGKTQLKDLEYFVCNQDEPYSANVLAAIVRGERDKQRENPLNSQIGGAHYKDHAIQPIEYMLANDLGYVEGAVCKYVSRWKDKGGLDDLRKARHLLDILIDNLEAQQEVKAAIEISGALEE